MIEQRFCFRSGPSVHRCHGELRLRNVSNRKPNHPIPAFVTKFSSFGCFLAKGDFHRRKSSLPRRPRSVRRSSPFVRFVGFSPLRLSGGRGKRDFPVSFCSFFFDNATTWGLDSYLTVASTTTTTTTSKTQTRAVAF